MQGPEAGRVTDISGELDQEFQNSCCSLDEYCNRYLDRRPIVPVEDPGASRRKSIASRGRLYCF